MTAYFTCQEVKILTATNVKHLEETINEHLKDGWLLIGNPFLGHGKVDDKNHPSYVEINCVCQMIGK